MSQRDVATQSELDQAIADGITNIDIRSADGVWLDLRSPGSSHVVAWDSSHVVAWKARRVRVVREVDRYGQPLAATKAGAR